MLNLFGLMHNTNQINMSELALIEKADEGNVLGNYAKQAINT